MLRERLLKPSILLALVEVKTQPRQLANQLTKKCNWEPKKRLLHVILSSNITVNIYSRPYIKTPGQEGRFYYEQQMLESLVILLS